MAIEVVFFYGAKREGFGGEGSAMGKVGHSCLHLVTNVDDRIATSASRYLSLQSYRKGNANVHGLESE